MVKLKFSNADNLKYLINGLKNVSESINFKFLKDGIEIKGLDNSKSALIDAFLHESYFETYQYQKDINFGIFLESFWKILKSIRKNDTAELYIPKSEDFLKITLENNTRKGVFKLKAIDLEPESVSIPPIDYDNKMSIFSNKFYHMISDLHQFESKDIKIFTKDENILFGINSNLSECEISFKTQKYPIREKNGKKYKVIKKAGKEIMSLITDYYEMHNVKNDTNLVFNADYLYKFAQLYQLCPEVVLEFSNTMPLKIKYNLNASSYLKYYLAPKCD